MKKTITRVSMALFIIAWSMVQSCIFFEVSIEGRIAQFVDDLNSTDRSQAYLNFHSRPHHCL